MNNIILDNELLILKDNEDKEINIKKDINTKIILINEQKANNKFIINLEENSSVILNILDASDDINRKVIINLSGKNSYSEVNISSISLGNNNYIVDVYHNEKNTHSETNLHGLTIGHNKITFKNNGSIKKGSIKSILNQDNKIITLDKNNSKIEPNLFIDEYDVSASHGAYIGKFKEEDIFYLKTRGLNENECNNLLINGFLLGNFDDKESLEKIIKKYWR
ncbi:MAG: SufD family Fe-S cluster assembly protein [Bacilli bacterium]|nr:SufD family Fe-S cluster assembly protein [Bacilli bacterium]